MDSSHLFNKILNAEQMAIASLDFENSLFLFLISVLCIFMSGWHKRCLGVHFIIQNDKDKSQQGEYLEGFKATFLYKRHLKL